jgi:hypothetical protein
VRAWGPRHWAVAIGAAVATVLVVGVPTDLVDTPLFTRMVPAPWWAWPGLVASAVLAGMLAATYVRDPRTDPPSPGVDTDPSAPSAAPFSAPSSAPDDRSATRGGYVGAALTYFAVGCPVCNKLVLLALGTTGAMSWFAPAQPVLQLAAIGLLGWALVRRLDAQETCPVPTPAGRP